MIEILVKIENTPPAEFVMSHGTGLHNGNGQSMKMARMGRVWKCKGRMIPSKSFTLGIYPKNLWWQDD